MCSTVLRNLSELPSIGSWRRGSHCTDMYRLRGENIPISIKPFPVDESVPEEEEIKWVVKRLRNNPSGGGVGNAGGTS